MVADHVCLRCGTKIGGQQVFCDECLDFTEGRPVNPNTPVLLPNRNTVSAPRKRFRKHIRKPEEQIHMLKNIVTGLIVVILMLLAALVLSLMLNFQFLGAEEFIFLPR